ncbi:ATP-binding cassette domain-containing protein [Stappia taiwanensis]|uniref:ATP-binding cassette domain-containing protein n=1 Tax=Stappia taiwanensis TaxID=992267 RepID=A0A838XSU1_9HYPH|nr:ATP-binding cassette domain-containing protein [Stappia taiwanensis]MBA4612807.1 ATP-binding cassette domain-containing protein [Stappia taiwanensis]GGE89926.1 ABC transporter ATP-binding protein [Stappia taiwanensis]
MRDAKPTPAPETPPPAGLVFDGVRIARQGVPLIALDARVAPGEVLTLMGPSGIGKSTLLAYAAGFLDPAFSAQGRVLVGGRDVTDLPAHRRHVGLLFQDPLLFPHLSVGDNLAFALPEAIRGRSARRDAVHQALSEVELGGYDARDPATLSGGQKARIALMRVLVSEPRALLLDEPFSKLDTGLKAQMRDLVFGKARRRGLPVLLVTHDRDDAAAAGGPIIDLSPGA